MAVLGARHPDVFDIMKEVATSFKDKREYAQAEQIASQRLDLSMDLYGPKSCYTWECLRTVGDLRWKLGRHADAEQVFARSLEVAADGGCMQLQSMLDVAEARRNLGRMEESEPVVLQAWQLYRSIPDNGHGAAVHTQFGKLYFTKGRLKEATEHQKQAIECTRERHGGKECPSCEFTPKKRPCMDDESEMF